MSTPRFLEKLRLALEGSVPPKLVLGAREKVRFGTLRGNIERRLAGFASLYSRHRKLIDEIWVLFQAVVQRVENATVQEDLADMRADVLDALQEMEEMLPALRAEILPMRQKFQLLTQRIADEARGRPL